MTTSPLTPCPTCAAPCRVVGHTTKHYEPVGEVPQTLRAKDEIMSDMHDAMQAKMFLPSEYPPFPGIPHTGSTALAMELTAARQRIAALEAELAAARATGLAADAVFAAKYECDVLYSMHCLYSKDCATPEYAAFVAMQNRWRALYDAWLSANNRKPAAVEARERPRLPDPAAVAAAVAEGRGEK